MNAGAGRRTSAPITAPASAWLVTNTRTAALPAAAGHPSLAARLGATRGGSLGIFG